MFLNRVLLLLIGSMISFGVSAQNSVLNCEYKKVYKETGKIKKIEKTWIDIAKEDRVYMATVHRFLVDKDDNIVSTLLIEEIISMTYVKEEALFWSTSRRPSSHIDFQIEVINTNIEGKTATVRAFGSLLHDMAGKDISCTYSGGLL